MKLSLISMTFFVLASAFFGNVGLAKGQPVPESSQGLSALVVKEGEPICIARPAGTVNGARIDELEESFGLPNCEVLGVSNELIETAFEAGASKKETQIAALTHVAVFAGGCLYGALAPMFAQSLISDDDATKNFALGSLAGGIGATAVAMSGTMTAGHSWALAGGYTVCTGGLNFLLFREKSQRGRTGSN